MMFLVSLLLAGQAAALAHNASYTISAKERHLEADGKPFFWQGDTAWAYFHRFNEAEATTYLDNRAAKGFNIIVTVGLSQFGPDDSNRAGDLPLIDNDPLQPNEKYWSYVDKLYQMAWDRGIRIAFVPTWGYYIHSSIFRNVSINATNAFAFGQWFGARYPDSPYLLVGDTNPHWTNKTAVSSDYTIGGVPQTYNWTDYSLVYDGLAEGLIAGASGTPLITIHPTNQWFSGTPIATASANYGDRDWLTLDACQSGHADYPPNPPIPWWNARRGYEPIEIMYNNQDKIRPVLDNEPHYENRFNNGKPDRPAWNASDIRKGSFQAVFSGAAGVVYGSDNVMQGYIPDVYESANSGPAISWEIDLDLAGAYQVQNVKKLLTDRAAWPYIVPDSTFLSGDLGRNDNKTMGLRASDNSAIMVYAPLGGQLNVNTACLGEGSVAGSWFDPVDGSYSTFDANPARAVLEQSVYDCPINETHTDWVLLLERQ